MPDDSRKIFQENLLYYMELNRITQQDIVNALDVSKSTVSDWCHGKNYPRIDVMKRLADFLGVVMNKLTISNDHSDELSSDEKVLLTGYRSLPPAGKDYMLTQISAAKAIYGEKDSQARDTGEVI